MTNSLLLQMASATGPGHYLEFLHDVAQRHPTQCTKHTFHDSHSWPCELLPICAGSKYLAEHNVLASGTQRGHRTSVGVNGKQQLSVLYERWAARLCMRSVRGAWIPNSPP